MAKALRADANRFWPSMKAAALVTEGGRINLRLNE